MLVANGYTYRKSKLIKNTIYWLCANKGCNARAILNHSGEFKVSKLTCHNHPPNYEDAIIRNNMVALRKLALQSNDPPDVLMKAVGIEEDPNKRYLNSIRMWRSKAKRKSKLQLVKALQLHDYTEEPTSSIGGTDYKLVKTERASNLMVCHNGFIYRKHRTKNDYTYWRCREKGCNATAKMSEAGWFTVTNKAHNHKSCAEDVEEVMKNRLILKQLALETTETPENLLNLLGIEDSSDKRYIESIKTWRSTARRKIRKEERLMKILDGTEYIPISGNDYHFVKTERATHLFIYFRGFIYRKYKENDKISYWRCRSKFCKAGGKLDGTGCFIVTNNNHNHEVLQFEDGNVTQLDLESAFTGAVENVAEETVECTIEDGSRIRSSLDQLTAQLDLEDDEEDDDDETMDNVTEDISNDYMVEYLDTTEEENQEEIMDENVETTEIE